jgi:dienelactone hydrolase
MPSMPTDLTSRANRVYRATAFAHDGMRHDVYEGGTGPTVILIHEAGGLEYTTLDIADRLWAEGFRVLLPVLAGRPRSDGSGSSVVANLLKLCVSREVFVFLTGRTSRIATWLRALAAREKGHHQGVGVIGMCFSGGFALAAAVDESVIAAIGSQPALPWPLLPGSGADLGLSPADLACVRERYRDGTFGFLATRYTMDRGSPAARIERIKTEFGTDVVIEPIGTAHSVLANAADPAKPDPIAVPALEATIALLTERLRPAAASTADLAK